MNNPLQIVVFLLVLLLTVPVLGKWMNVIFQESPLNFPILSTIEKYIYKICSINPKEEMTWKTYLNATLLFNLMGLISLFLLQLVQHWLPLNPQKLPSVEPSLAFNTAISFVTNTNWQAYGGEITLSYLTQMLGLTTQNFVSAATGNAVLLALIRGITRKKIQTIGNFWVDLVRTVLYLLLPLCVFFTLFLVSQGVIQNIDPYIQATTSTGEVQTIPMGPVASQISIKQIGTNGGGFFNANSAHPYENPTPLTNFLECWALLCIPAAATYMYGSYIRSRKEGWVLFGVMFFLWIIGFIIALASEYTLNPFLEISPYLEGKETRFGIDFSILWATLTTATSNGSVNNMLSSLSPLAGGVALFNMMIGEVIFGGIGVGLCGMLMFVFLTIFLAGLMVGRTPEYLGKKIEKFEMQWVMLAILTPCALILLGASLAIIFPKNLESILNKGPHGLSEIFYAFSSSAGNNGSAFAGLNANTYFYNISLGIIMLIARLAIIISSLAIAGSLGKKDLMATSSATFATNNFLFGLLLLSVIFIIAALTFFPALSLGPFVEHMLMIKGKSF